MRSIGFVGCYKDTGTLQQEDQSAVQEDQVLPREDRISLVKGVSVSADFVTNDFGCLTRIDSKGKGKVHWCISVTIAIHYKGRL
jgi:hypothetical protein